MPNPTQENAGDHGDLLSPQQVADRLDCSRPHIYDLAHLLCRHSISAKTVSTKTKTRFCEAGLRAYIASTAVDAA